MHMKSLGADMFVRTRSALTRDAFKNDFAYNAYAQCNNDGNPTSQSWVLFINNGIGMTRGGFMFILLKFCSFVSRWAHWAVLGWRSWPINDSHYMVRRLRLSNVSTGIWSSLLHTLSNLWSATKPPYTKSLDVRCHVHVFACSRNPYFSAGTGARYNPRCRVEAWRPAVAPMSLIMTSDLGGSNAAGYHKQSGRKQDETATKPRRNHNETTRILPQRWRNHHSKYKIL